MPTTEAEAHGAAHVPHLYTLSSLRAAQFTPPVPLVEGFLHEGETVVLAGKPKVGKSRFLGQLTLAVSRGTPFLGMTVPQERKILYIDLENHANRVQDRFHRMSGPDPADDLIHIYAPERLDENLYTSSATGANALKERVQLLQPDLLVIDPWRLFLGGDENDAKDTLTALERLSALREVCPRLAIIIVHHLRKSGKDSVAPKLLEEPGAWVEAASGHNALLAHTDAVYGLSREQQSGPNRRELIVFNGIARSLDPPQLILDEDDDLTFRVSQGAEALVAVLTPAERKLWDIATTLGAHFTQTQLAKTSGTGNKRAARRFIEKALAHGVVAAGGNAWVLLSPPCASYPAPFAPAA